GVHLEIDDRGSDPLLPALEVPGIVEREVDRRSVWRCPRADDAVSRVDQPLCGGRRIDGAKPAQSTEASDAANASHPAGPANPSDPTKCTPPPLLPDCATKQSLRAVRQRRAALQPILCPSRNSRWVTVPANDRLSGKARA